MSIASPQNGSTINPSAAASPLAAWDTWSHLPVFVELPAGKKAPPPKGMTGLHPSRPARLLSEIPPGHNVGMLCGPSYGQAEPKSVVPVVLDLDVPEERPRMLRFLVAHGLQTAATVKTGGKHDGFQYYIPITLADWHELDRIKTGKDWVFDDTAPGGARPTRPDEDAHFEMKRIGYVVCPPSVPADVPPETPLWDRVLNPYLFIGRPLEPARCAYVAERNGAGLRAFVDGAWTRSETNSRTVPLRTVGLELCSLPAGEARSSGEGSKGGTGHRPTASESEHPQPRGVPPVDHLFPFGLDLWQRLAGRMHAQRYTGSLGHLSHRRKVHDFTRPMDNLDANPSAAFYVDAGGEGRITTFAGETQSFDFLDVANVYLTGAPLVRLGSSERKRVVREVVDYFGIWTKRADRFRASTWPARYVDGLCPELRATAHHIRDRAIEYMRLDHEGAIASVRDIADRAGCTRDKAGYAVEVLRFLGLVKRGGEIPTRDGRTWELVPLDADPVDVAVRVEELRRDHRVDLAKARWCGGWKNRARKAYGFNRPPKQAPAPLEPQRDADTERARAFIDSLRATLRHDARSRGVGCHLHQVDVSGEELRTYPPPATGPP